LPKNFTCKPNELGEFDESLTTHCPVRKRQQWSKIAGPEGSKAAVSIRQDASIFATDLLADETLDYTVEPGRHAWLQVARGSLIVNGTRLLSGDAIATSRRTQLHLQATEPTDALLFDLA
jgi:quercetin 2,3-dioxygenase